MINKKSFSAVALVLAWAGVSFASPSARSADAKTNGPCISGVKTTAYSASVEDNGPNEGRNALGRPLKSGSVTSAAADWSRWPVGTRFRVVETGRIYIVDDYGSALVGTGTIDLYKSSDAQVDRWGVRHVTIEVLEWGSPERSLKILRERDGNRHVRKMVRSLLDQENA
jgi:3D (Asp-Asp-Asp) domain-containing protein